MRFPLLYLLLPPSRGTSSRVSNLVPRLSAGLGPKVTLEKAELSRAHRCNLSNKMLFVIDVLFFGVVRDAGKSNQHERKKKGSFAHVQVLPTSWVWQKMRGKCNLVLRLCHPPPPSTPPPQNPPFPLHPACHSSSPHGPGNERTHVCYSSNIQNDRKTGGINL